jgi:hypothetical protein
MTDVDHERDHLRRLADRPELTLVVYPDPEGSGPAAERRDVAGPGRRWTGRAAEVVL